jgi:cytochrome c oxidase subunit III
MAHDSAHLAPHFRDLEQQHETASLGMWVFLATEVMVFGAIFTGYAVYRTAYADEFAAASSRLNLKLGTINTIVLLSSSLTMALAVHWAQMGRRKFIAGFLGLTMFLGVAFLVIKGLEYRDDYEKNLVPGLAFQPQEWLTLHLRPERVQLFLLFYYILTGLHALHMIIGLGILTVLLILAWRGHFSPAYYAPVEVGGLYWHFVDIIWIFLLPLLYLIGT